MIRMLDQHHPREGTVVNSSQRLEPAQYDPYSDLLDAPRTHSGQEEARNEQRRQHWKYRYQAWKEAQRLGVNVPAEWEETSTVKARRWRLLVAALILSLVLILCVRIVYAFGLMQEWWR